MFDHIVTSIVAYYLKYFLGEFVDISSTNKRNNGDENLSLQEQISVAVSKGVVTLKDLVLKDKIVDVLGLPFKMRHGFVGSIEIIIPYSKLGTEPVVVVINQVHILLEPKYEWDPAAEENRNQTIKNTKLVAAELFAKNRLDQQDDMYTNIKQYLKESFITKIIDNIQITVRGFNIFTHFINHPLILTLLRRRCACQIRRLCIVSIQFRFLLWYHSRIIINTIQRPIQRFQQHHQHT